jgi:phosphoserine phosphatase RsbU/P
MSGIGPSAHRVLLIDDQKIIGETVRQMLAAESDIIFEFCQDPVKAIPTANVFKPTVILQDLIMPDVDGLQLVKFFRVNTETKLTPLVVLSSKEEPVIKAKAFGLGANDYLVKLPDKLELIARIRYHSQGYNTLLQRNEMFEQLAEKQRETARELAQADRYVQSLLPLPLKHEKVQIDWRFIPSTSLGGDMFGYHWLDDDHFAIYLLDVSGHGVGSSLLAVSAMNLISAQSLPGTDCRDPGAVLSKLNDVFQMEKQDGKYFTIWYGVYQPSTRTLKYSNGGHPPALLYDGDKREDLESCGPGVAIAEGFPFDTTSTNVAPNARLLVYSDGVFEIEKEDGQMWELGDFFNAITSQLHGEGSIIDRHHRLVRSIHGDGPLGDDFSMMEILFPAS